MPWVYRIPTGLLGVLIVGFFVGFAGIGLLVSRALMQPPATDHNDIAGFLYAVIGVIYGVLLGLTAVAAWDDYQNVKVTSVQEANALQNLVHGIQAFGEPTRSTLLKSTSRYVHSVVFDEWPAMHRAEDCLQTQEAAEEMLRTWIQVKPLTEAEVIHLERNLQQLHIFLERRQLRLNAAKEGLDSLMWGILLFGALITIGYTFFFWAENHWLHAMMCCSLAALIGIIIYWIVIYDHPLWGAVRVTPEPFDRVLKEFEAQGYRPEPRGET